MGRPAVVLLSGGLDSTTVLAIARRARLRLSCPVVPLRPTARGRARSSGARRCAGRRRAARGRRHRPAGLRRLGAHRRHRGPQARRRRRDWATRSRSPTCPPATPSSCRSPWRGPRCWALATSSSGSTPSTTAATPTAGPSSSTPSQRWPNLATKAGVEGTTSIKIHTPLIDLTKAQIIQRRHRARRRLRPHHQLLRRRRRRQGVRPLRLVPPAAAGASPTPASPTRRRTNRDGLPVTLPGQGDLLHPAGRGHQAGRPAVFCRFTGCNLWTGPRGAPRHRRSASSATPTSSAPTAPAAAVRDGRRPGRRRRGCLDRRPRRRAPFVVCTGGEPLLQLDDELVAALHARGVRDRHRDQRHARCPRGIDWICVSPKAGADSSRPGDELKLVVPAGRAADPTAFEHLELRALLPAADGRTRARRNTELADRSTAWPTPAGGSASRPTSTWGSPDGDLQGVHLRGGPPPAERARRPQVRPPARPLVPGARRRVDGPVGDETGWVRTSPT